MSLSVRPAQPADCGILLTLIRELAEYEKMLDQVENTEEMLRESLFGERPYVEALIGELEGQPAGMALFFHNYSTFVGRPGIYLEDIYVRPEGRGRGLGKALLLEVAKIAHERDCGRLDWSVLDWNQPAIDFYERLGAKIMRDWLPTRVDRAGIARMAELE